MSAAAGSRIGPYEITALLGAGGMGQVWRAHDTRLERDVALKVLPAETLGDATARARLIREARLASKLNHPHICTIYEVGEADGQTFIAMELVEGRPLSDLLTDGGLPAGKVLDIGRQLADALAHAHDRGVVHRDLKSNNVIVTPEGRVKVLDFGLAKRLAPEAGADATTLTRQASLTEAGTIVGTLAYMAPEQLRGQPADARSDIWALGVVLYELLSGERPFQGKTGFELSSAILSQPAPPVPESVAPPLAAIVERCLAKEPAARYQRADEVRAALEVAASGQVPALPVARRRRGFSRLLIAAAGVLVVAVVAAAVTTLDIGGLRSRLAGPAATPARVVRLMVLPFANVSGDAAQEYLSEGLTTEMIALLGRLHPETLQVIARTTAMSYKKTAKRVDEIARELQPLAYVLEGSARREGDRIHINAALIKVSDQTQIWGETYDRPQAGILVLQNEVAQQVAKALALKLLPAEQARLAGARTVNPEAYEAYLKGSQSWIRMTPGDVDTAERYFEAALQKDPDYAAAYTGLAWVWAVRSQMGFVPPAVAVPQAKAAATKALGLDDGLAEAHYALASLLTWCEWNAAAAGREWERATRLNPNWAEGVAMYSHYLLTVHQPAEAITQVERAVKLDPFNVTVHAFYTVALKLASRFDDALAEARTTLKMQADNPVAVTGLVHALYATKRFDEAAVASQGAYRNWHPDLADAVKEGLAESGYKGAFRRVADMEVAKYAAEPGIANDAGYNYLLAGDYDRAITWFDKAFEGRDPNLPYLACDPLVDPLRSDPRFQALLRKIGLPLR